MEQLDEGDKCPTCDTGELVWQSHHSNSCCSCHLSPPCSYCTDQDLACNKCGEIAVEYEPPAYAASPVRVSLTTHKTVDERYAELPDGVFGCISYPSKDGWGMTIKGKLKKGMSREEILSACGICEHGMPHFKHRSDSEFLLTYTYD